MKQQGITIIHRVLPGKITELRELLNKIGQDIGGNGIIDFYSLSTVHFMRWVILDEAEVRGETIPAQLVLSTNFDGATKAHLMELALKARKGLDQIYSHCEGYPKNGSTEAVANYLGNRRRKNAAFYGGTVGRSVKQIHQESDLWYGIKNFLQHQNSSQNWEGQQESEIREDIRKGILTDPKFSWLKKQYIPPFLYRFGPIVLGAGILAGLSLVVLGFIFIPWITLSILGVKIAVIAWWMLSLKAHEERDRKNFVPAPRDPGKLAFLTRREDYKVQNQITHLVDIKPGFFRQATLRFILWAINLLARTFFNKGNLGGIPSIHFARWAIIDNGKRLLFFSNFDGSWESYLGEFIDRAAIGLTAVWTNTEGFPPTRGLIKEGARNSADFKAWVRQKQIETQVWYSAYKHLTVENVNNNTEIRQGLTRPISGEAITEWLQRL